MLVNKIKEDRQNFKKQQAKTEANILTTLFSEVQRLDKADQEDDKKVLGVITKYVKGLKEMIALTEDSSDFEKELEVVSVYLPKQLTEVELTTYIDYAIAETDAKTMQDMGKVMKALKRIEGASYDGKLASTIVRGKLA